MRADALERLIWIDIPEGSDTDIGPFTLDPGIPLPIEDDGESEDFDFTVPSWDAVIGGVLVLLAGYPAHEHADYYRSFVLALEPDMVSDLAEKAEEYGFEKDWENAEDAISALLGLSPLSPEARFAGARFYDSRWEWERRRGDARIADEYAAAAEAAYGELVSDPRAPRDARCDAGVFFYRRGDFSRALDAAQSYLEVPGGDEEREREARRIVRFCRDEGQTDETCIEAYAALNSGRAAEGVRLAEEFRASRPESRHAWFLLGWGYRLLGDWEAARGALEGARERGCRDYELYSETAVCARALGDYDAAVDALAEILRRDPENVKIISNMAVVMMEKGDESEALRWIRIALVLEPDDPVCTQLMNELDD